MNAIIAVHNKKISFGDGKRPAATPIHGVYLSMRARLHSETAQHPVIHRSKPGLDPLRGSQSRRPPF
ncbi:hypothetical protein [Candidatus Rhodobacter oscarellae]|uniref:hypothetical protein n=1 Tax=Candidatus Rhodobacter oscarellae TaxID=1675527 RepID=UPI000670D49D|nr:hypothetical protein [Candidatus Rhodobacter lobularis]